MFTYKHIPFFVVFLLFLSPSIFAKDNFLCVQSKHFTLIGNVNENKLKEVGTKLEQYRNSFSLVFPAIRLDDFQPVNVFVFDSKKSFKPFAPIYNGQPRDNIAGYFLTDENANYIAIRTDSGLNFYELIFHEYAHFIIGKNFANVPVWFNEGLAEFYSSFETSKNNKTVQIGAQISRHTKSLKKKKWIPFQLFLRVDRKSPYFNESDKNSIFYAQSWALVHYLILGNQQKRRNQIQSFLTNLNQGFSIEDAFKQAFQADYNQIENELRDYLTKPFPVIEETLAQQSDTTKNFRIVPIAEPELEILFGDLQAYVGRLDEAANRFQKTINLNPNFADGYLYLAKLRLYQGRIDEAQPLVEKAVALNPKNWLAQFYYGNFLRDSNKIEEAKTAYMESIKLAPEFPRSHAALGSLLYKMNQIEEAAKEFEKAIKYEPLKAEHYRDASYAFFRLRKFQQAAARANSFLQLKGWKDEHSARAALIVYFGSLQSKQETSILKDASINLDFSSSLYPVVRYAKGEITAEQLIAQTANNNDKLTEAHAYIGIDLSLKGNFTEALKHLNWVKENGNKNFYEYGFALAEIQYANQGL